MSNWKEMIDNIIQIQNISSEEFQNALRILETPFEELLQKKHRDLTDYRENNLMFDMLDGTYCKLNKNGLELLRTCTLDSKSQETNPVKVADIIISVAKQLDEAAERMEYNQACYNAVITVFMIEVCKQMMFNGASLSEILKYVPRTSASDVYKLGERYLGYKMNLTEEERQMVDKDAALTGTNQTINLADAFKIFFHDEIPKKNGNQWSLQCGDNTLSGTAAYIAQLFTESEMCYQYKNEKDKTLFATTFDNVIDALLTDPKHFSINGCEECYSKMELDLLQRVQMKMLNIL